jgi:sulfur carrier protein
MELTLNGELRAFPQPMTVLELLAHLAVATDRVAVEVNRAVIPRTLHGQHALKAGDVVEVVTFVGGG